MAFNAFVLVPSMTSRSYADALRVDYYTIQQIKWVHTPQRHRWRWAAHCWSRDAVEEKFQYSSIDCPWQSDKLGRRRCHCQCSSAAWATHMRAPLWRYLP